MSQSVMYLTADPEVVSSIPAWSHTFVGIYHENISTAILFPSADSRRVVVSCKQKYVHEEGLVNHLVNLAQDKCVYVNRRSRHDNSCLLGCKEPNN